MGKTKKPAGRLYRQHTARLKGTHWGSMTAEPAVLGCGAGRFFLVRNVGPDPLFLSSEEGGKADRTLEPLDEKSGKDAPEAVIRDSAYLRSAGESLVTVQEFFEDAA